MMMSRIFAPKSALAVLLIASTLCMGTTGCSQNPTQTVQNVVNVLSQVKAYVDSTQALLPGLQSLDPALASEVQEYAELGSTNLANLIAIGNAYLAAPSSDKYQQLLNGVDSFTAGIDTTVLQAAKIANPNTQHTVLIVLGLADTGAHLAVSLLKQYASSSQLKAMPKTAQVDFDLIKPFIVPDYARAQLASMGYQPYEVEHALSKYGLSDRDPAVNTGF